MKIEEYTSEKMTLKIGDSLSINERVICIKEIFAFNEELYIGYDDNQNNGYVMKTVEDFHENYKDYLHTLKPLLLAKNNTTDSCHNCNCHG
jgi:hypothetical protein